MEKQGSRALLAAVIGMGVLLAVGSLVLVGVLVHRISHPRDSAPEPVQAAAGTGAQAVLPQDLGRLVLDEPAGTHVTSLARQGDTTLAVALTGGGADRVIIWDLARNRIIGRLQVSP
ncbi:hypothetical protein K6L44_08910 [Gluconacetobacter entanii]|uniref:Uncharacterized protein n=1 Tax=Gluconacetobacter entanii TaxID=108528 RepID=A0A318Q6Q7_9PROT|nr:hypothetical protein [Gluconacetobacter entanii]MCE2579779.1 hypothetical protein [Komagataeibacter sp. FNDCR1]MBY4640102.1 hypothetical protein [Gluconacetobacter entanii]MCE2579785.1 hypothetical protein [Komagataeibacter sp. FNDCR1]MCW4579776.1 hypothetical protein [Gluconacetobacter entanii]MCW4583160.1 hypothetical protein [Gluconacetobacter entanii]